MHAHRAAPPPPHTHTHSHIACAGLLPGGSTVQYEIQLLRLSRVGPEALFSGVASCGGGFVMARAAGCADISAAEFL